MVNVKTPANPIQNRGLWPPKNFAAFHYATDMDNWSTIAKKYNIPVAALIQFNFGTQKPEEINWYLRELIGCKLSGPDGYNYSFRDADLLKRIIYIPKGASLPVPTPLKPTIYDIYDILDKRNKQSNHKYKVRLKDMIDRLRSGKESRDDRVIQWHHISPAKSRYGPTAKMIGGSVPADMPMRGKYAPWGVDDIWIEKNLKSISDINRQPVIRNPLPTTRFVTSIRWELTTVTFGGNVSTEYYEDKLWMIFTNIHKHSNDSYIWLDAWANTGNVMTPSTIGVGYKAIYKWHQAQAQKPTSPIYSIRTIK